MPSNAGCGLTNHPDGHLYSNTDEGVAQLDASTGAAITTFGPAGNALGITVDPKTGNLIYVGSDCDFSGSCTIEEVNPANQQAQVFANLPGSVASFVDGITFDPSGQFLFLSTRAPGFDLTILNRSGTVVQAIPMSHEPDGIAFHSTDPQFLVTNDIDGTITRFDFAGNDYSQAPAITQFASGGYRGDLSAVGTDGCIYLSQNGTNFLDGTTSPDDSIVQICPGFAPSPGNGPIGPVYVALGDSYSSGEGAPPFEDGTNYPPALQQENTYTYGPDPTSCHRSLTNYAKLFAPTIAVAGETTTLIDRTCSGAKIGSAASPSKGPIIPPNPATGVPSQVTQAEDRLVADYGLPDNAVNVVSVTMGGNDGGFGSLILACMIPSIAKVLFQQYDNVPGEIEFVVSHFASCQNLDSLLFHTGDQITALPGLEELAQTFISDTFEHASIYQLTYPGILPTPSDYGGDSCGGILRSDAKYVRSKVQAIDDAIRTAGEATRASQSDPNFNIVDIQNAFGASPLCPPTPARRWRPVSTRRHLKPPWPRS